ncbi:PIN domain-containing protein [Pseudanabaena sp. FACHB-1998]|uniref:type II toxin-antitoxin system VapC family toxin n=1 Tax=Pseudanabaena sp. FACHB-1998 TaxID=2692858 RepID=UPI00168044C5|nr:PIN domain-containing protein [Pseudanabaena sp. FACHB-1998]MBD2176239.1 PIN domain-containing protein [Pseudanabaena sp. FACHB-1998]
MKLLVLLDTGVLGKVTNPKTNQDCLKWLSTLEPRGYKVAIPEIADYELRRELIRANKLKGLQRLDRLKNEIIYLPITTSVMIYAAKLWAEVRQSGQATADPKSLDGDVILAAQALLQVQQGYEVIVATTNVKHISRFVDARLWTDI